MMMALWWLVMRKIIRISKTNRITSLADFISSRYGKSALLAGLVTVIAVIGVVPYIALQLKAVSNSFTMLVQYPDVVMPAHREAVPIQADTAFWMALLLATFTILFGTRHLDASERHEGMVAAIAFESLVKLVAFLAVGIFVTYGIYGGLADIFVRASAHARLANLFAPMGGAAGSYASWAWLTVLSMLAIMFLPRQFQIAVVENVNENHLGKAIWLFPLYMLAMNLFVVPDRLRRRHAFPRGRRRPGHFRADAADGREAGGARPARVHRRAVGRHRHGDRRDHRPVDDGVQRPGDARAAAHALDAARANRRTSPACCSEFAGARSSRSCCSAISTTASPAKPTRWWRSA